MFFHKNTPYNERKIVVQMVEDYLLQVGDVGSNPTVFFFQKYKGGKNMLLEEQRVKKSIDDAWFNVDDEFKLEHYMWEAFTNLQRLMYKCTVITKDKSDTKQEALNASIRQWRNYDKLLKHVTKLKGKI